MQADVKDFVNTPTIWLQVLQYLDITSVSQLSSVYREFLSV